MDVIVIDKLHYQKLLNYNQKRREYQLLVELKTLPLFKAFSQSHMKKIVQWFQPVKKLMHSFLYRENDLAQYVYIVKDGEFKQTIKMSLPNQKSVIEP